MFLGVKQYIVAVWTYGLTVSERVENAMGSSCLRLLWQIYQSYTLVNNTVIASALSF